MRSKSSLNPMLQVISIRAGGSVPKELGRMFFDLRLGHGRITLRATLSKELRMEGRDLIALWEAHCRCEFETRDADATMATMVPEPYVNHIPTMTGGVGHEQLKRFYKYHFIGVNPPDFHLTPVSRTVGTDSLVDEFIVRFTHTIEMDWLLPGVPPTGRAVEIPTVAIVKFHGDKLVHEHIYWDQASVLVQLGLLDPAGLPIAGVEAARKVVDQTLPSNGIMTRWEASKNKPL
jgi:carboxymethylenebutenolidase